MPIAELPHDDELSSPSRRDRCAASTIRVFLLLAVTLVFGQAIGHDFVSYDDPRYVWQNPHVSGGLTSEGMLWAFTHTHGFYWHPLTGLSHMLDCQLFGLWAEGHHAINLLLHGGAVVLLFMVLRQMTGKLWPSAFVAAVFAIHPLRVESVAWVSERKDVLSGLFFMLTLAAYVDYARRPFSLTRYLLVALLFSLGLMAKPMLVTLPFVLLLLDYWPLGRGRWGLEETQQLSTVHLPLSTDPLRGYPDRPPSTSFSRLLAEKLPLLALAAAASVATLLAQSEAMKLNACLSLPWRIGNALVSYVAYVVQFICPLELTVFYPHPGYRLAAWKIVAAFLVLAGTSLVALASRRRPYLLVGWLWYLGMLVPTIGLVQVGLQAMADRYTYLPQLGLSIALAWGVADVCRSWPCRRWLCGAGSALVLGSLMASAWLQTSHWRNSETLWSHAVACNPQNAKAHCYLGMALADLGQLDEAITHFRKALEIQPDEVEARAHLRAALDQAVNSARRAAELTPGDPAPLAMLATAYATAGRTTEAAQAARKAVDLATQQSNPALAETVQARIRLYEASDPLLDSQQVLASRPARP